MSVSFLHNCVTFHLLEIASWKNNDVNYTNNGFWKWENIMLSSTSSNFVTCYSTKIKYFNKSQIWLTRFFAVKVIRIKKEWSKALLPPFVWYKEHRSSPLGWIARSRCSWWAGTKTNEVTLSAVSEPRFWAIFDLTRPCLRFPHCKTPWV